MESSAATKRSVALRASKAALFLAVIAGGFYVGAALADWWNGPTLVQPVVDIPVVALDSYSTPVVATELLNSAKPKKNKKRKNKSKYRSWGWQPF